MSNFEEAYERLKPDIEALVNAGDGIALTHEQALELGPVALRVAEAWSPELDEWFTEKEEISLTQDVLDTFVRALEGAGDCEKALRLVDRMMELDRSNVAYYAGEKAYLLAQAGDPGDAVAHIQRIRETWPDDVWIHIKSARAFQMMGRHGEAADLLTHVLLNFDPGKDLGAAYYDIEEQLGELALSLEQSGLPDGDARFEEVFLQVVSPTGWEKAFGHIAAFPRYRALRLLKLLDRFREKLAPTLLDILSAAAKNPDDYRHSDELLWIVLTLGDWREARALPPLFEILRLPEEDLDDLFGDLLLEVIPLAMAGMSGPEHIEELVRFAGEHEPFEFAAAIGLSALEYLIIDGLVTPRHACELVRPLLDRVPVGRYVWEDAATFLTRLGDTDAWRRVEEAYPTGKLQMLDADYEELRNDLQLSEPEAIEQLRELLPWREYDARTAFVQWTIAHDIDESADDDLWDDDEDDDEWVMDPGSSEEEWTRAWQRYREGKNPWAREPYVAPPKVGRNEPCPCESGKKYKKCCGK